MEKLGALWIQKSKKSGKKYLKGKIGKVSIVVFENEQKQSEKSPDYKIFRSEPKEAVSDDVPF